MKHNTLYILPAEEKQVIRQKQKIDEIKQRIENNWKILESTTFIRFKTEYRLDGRDSSHFCEPCRKGKNILTNQETENAVEIKFCPDHFKVWNETREDAKKENKRLAKRLAKLENIA